MNVKNYLKLRDFCNNILNNNKINFLKYYYQYLFVLKETPEVMFQYSEIFVQKKNFKKIKSKNIKNIHKIIKYLKTFTLNYKYFYKKIKTTKKVDVIIFSHLLNSKKIYKNYEDLYFGRLPGELIQNDLKFKIIYRNMSQYLNSDKYLDNYYSIVIPNSSGFKNEVINLIKCIFYFFTFKKQINKNYKDSYFEEKKFFLKVGVFFSIINNLRFEYYIKHIIKTLKPRYVISTFEGHSWERILFKVSNDHNVKTFAYQHSMLTKYQNTIFLKFPNIYNPTYILTTGKVTNDRFQQFKFKNTYIVGSPKNIDSKLNIKPIKNTKKYLNILILPDAYIYEVDILLKLLVKIISNDKVNKYHLRLHPKTKLKDTNQKVLQQLKSCNNIEISKKSLEEDINLCEIVIYRGTASIIQSCSTGIYPLYYNNNEKISFDPLFEVFKDQSNFINNENDFFLKIEDYKKYWLIGKDSKNLELKKYCNSYFEEINYVKIINFLN